MKPTFYVHFSDEHPRHPGLWLARRENLISALEIQESDIERDQRDPTWLDGEWGAELRLADRDTVGFQRPQVQSYLDARLRQCEAKRRELQASLNYVPERDKSGIEQAVSVLTAKIECFQTLCLDLLGEILVLPVDDTDTDPSRSTP